MGPTVGRFRAGVLVLLLPGLLACCAGPQPAVKKEEPAGISVHVPALEPMDIETRTQPPVVQPQVVLPPPHPDAVEEGKARSLKLIEIQHGGGIPSRPPGSAPEDIPEKP